MKNNFELFKEDLQSYNEVINKALTSIQSNANSQQPLNVKDENVPNPTFKGRGSIDFDKRKY